MPQLELLPGSISSLFAHSAQTNTLTEADRYGLLAALLSGDIDEDERQAIDRILYFLRRGKLAIA